MIHLYHYRREQSLASQCKALCVPFLSQHSLRYRQRNHFYWNEILHSISVGDPVLLYVTIVHEVADTLFTTMYLPVPGDVNVYPAVDMSVGNVITQTPGDVLDAKHPTADNRTPELFIFTTHGEFIILTTPVSSMYVSNTLPILLPFRYVTAVADNPALFLKTVETPSPEQLVILPT